MTLQKTRQFTTLQMTKTSKPCNRNRSRAGLPGAVPRSHGSHVQAILALEAACVQRDVSAPMRMALVGLYGVLGAADPLVEQCDILEIKNIMLDSIAGALPDRLSAPRYAFLPCGIIEWVRWRGRELWHGDRRLQP
jgi:hypothetical protein